MPSHKFKPRALVWTVSLISCPHGACESGALKYVCVCFLLEVVRVVSLKASLSCSLGNPASGNHHGMKDFSVKSFHY